jgi:hypothetical protein
MAELYEKGLEKLCKWVVRIVRVVDLDSDEPSLGTDEMFSMKMLVDAFDVLKQRPGYLTHCLDELAVHRRLALVSNFLSALTTGAGQFGAAKPIELNAHDPVRYISDMLAWIHQSLAGEKEIVAGLLRGSGPPTAVDQEVVKKHLEKCFESLCRPLQGRAEQVLILPTPTAGKEIQHALSFVGAYQIYNLFQFYRSMMLPFLQDTCVFMGLLQRLADTAMKSCYDLIQSEGAILESIPGPSSLPQMDLAPPPAMLDFVAEISQLLNAHETALVQMVHSDEKSENNFNQDPSLLISAALEPIFKTTDILCDTCGFNPSESAVLHINVLVHLQSILRRFEFTKSKLEILALDIHTHLSVLIDDQTNDLLQKFGVAGKLKKIHEHSNETSKNPSYTIKLCDMDGMDVTSLKLCLQQFYTSLIALGSLHSSDSSGKSGAALTICDRLQLQQLRLEARHGVARGISSAYSELFNAISDPRSGYAEPFSILQHSPEQFSTLMEV